MPKVTNPITGEVVAEFGYDQAGENMANEMVNNNPSLQVEYGENADFSPAGISDARNRLVNSPMENSYAPTEKIKKY
tara:strand:+ start:313 stop:543 length:231 start_codon:yes stop_codon:yes gene_type:complete